MSFGSQERRRWRGALAAGLFGAALSGGAWAQQTAETADTPRVAQPTQEIFALREPWGSAAWDARVRTLFLDAFDLDASGAIDRAEEVAAIACKTWYALDHERVARGAVYAEGVALTYGFARGGIWVGAALGLDEAVREDARAAALRCRIVSAEDLAQAEAEAEAAAAAARPESWRGATAADDDASGSTSPGELGSARLTAPAALGSSTDGALTDPSAADTAPDLVPDLVPDPDPTAAAIRAIRARWGEDAWVARARRVLLRAFDANRSGWIDTRLEVEAIGCAAWGALDDPESRRASPFRNGLLVVYGFRPGLNWLGGGLGFSREMRAAAYGAAVRCGLED